ncbi:unnamed protein product [Cuscuta europaea]|uniref:DUF4283 domain-containing protein n=1 Tax=Cuscuta europaea TaxID=41803 RepID=A0A9P0ZS23_CUSEU|nr:unnamed protein product [Cuscuta europaea]
MALLWRSGKGVSIKEIGKKMYLFIVYHRLGMDHVLDGGPWFFERNLLSLKEVKPEDSPLKIDLKEAEFWVQVYNVPYSLMNLGTARRIDNFIGSFVKYDDNQFDEKWEAYLCVRVCMDVSKSLKKGTTLKKSRIEHWVDFKYEKLPIFCFICGIIGHAIMFVL